MKASIVGNFQKKLTHSSHMKLGDFGFVQEGLWMGSIALATDGSLILINNGIPLTYDRFKSNFVVKLATKSAKLIIEKD